MERISEGILVGCGNPLLDISAVVDEELLRKYEMKPNDAILAGPRHMPLYKELVDKYKAEFIAGGSVQNTLRVSQWLLQKPNVTVFFGAVGCDNYAQILEEKARTDGVNVQYQTVPSEPTGTCAVLLTGTQRSLCANLAAANHFTVEHLRKASNRQMIEEAKFFYISGFFLTVSPPSFMEIAQHAQQHDCPLMMNLSAPFISQFHMQDLELALPYVDILFGNETEAITFSKQQGWETEDLREIGKRLLEWQRVNKKCERAVILTQGHDPVLVFQTGKEVREFSVESLKPEEVIDTNGAGDAFVGGFISQYVRDKPLDVCVRCGIWAAREIIKRSGCTFEGVPTFQE